MIKVAYTKLVGDALYYPSA